MTTTCDILPGDDNVPHVGPVPMGRPLKTSQAPITMSLGVIGELMISGEGVAEGCLNRPTETARVFVEHIDSLSGNTRYYRMVSSGFPQMLRCVLTCSQVSAGQSCALVRWTFAVYGPNQCRADQDPWTTGRDRGNHPPHQTQRWHQLPQAGPSLVAYVVLDREQKSETDGHVSS